MTEVSQMPIDVVVHAEAVGYWAEVPVLPGCVSQGDTLDELLLNIQEAIGACCPELADMTELRLVFQ